MARLILHIGTPKTGTTSIQSMLVNSKSVLMQKYNIITFSAQQRNQDLMYWFIQDIATHRGARVLGVNKSNVNQIKDNVRKTYTGMFEKNADKDCILSFEGLWSLNEQEIGLLKNVLSRYFSEITILAYMRDIHPLVVSSVNQIVKQGLESDNITTITNKTIDDIIYGINGYGGNSIYINNIWKWVAVFGEQNVIVRCFDMNNFYNNDLISDFFHCVGFNRVDINDLVRVKTNESFGKTSIQFISQYNKKYAIYDENDEFNTKRASVGRLAPRNIFQNLKEDKFTIDVKFTQEQAEQYNKNIIRINGLMNGMTLKPIIATDKTNDIPEIDQLPIDYSVELLNETFKVLNTYETTCQQQQHQIHALKRWLGATYSVPGMTINILEIFKAHKVRDVAIYGVRDVIGRIIFSILRRCCNVKYFLTDNEVEYNAKIVINDIKTIKLNDIDSSIQCVIISSGNDDKDKQLKQQIKQLTSSTTRVWIWSELI